MGKLSLDDVRQSAKDVKASKGSGKFFKCGEGKNVVRLFTFDSKPLKKTRLEHPIRRHYKLDGENPLCEKTPPPSGAPSATCGYCDRVEVIRSEEGDKTAKRMEASKKFVINVVPIIIGGNPVQSAKMMQFDAPTSVLETVLAVMDDSGNPDAYVGIEGRDLVINYDSKADPKRMYTAMFRDETASAKTTAALRKVKDALLKAVVDLDSDPHLLPEWWKKKNGIKDAPKGEADDRKPAGKAAGNEASESPFTDDDAPAADEASPADADEPPAADEPEPQADGEDGALGGDEPTGGEPPADDDTPAEEPPAEEPEPEADPVYEGTLPKGVTAFWSEGKKKFYFKMPNGKTTFDEAAALAAGGPAKPKAGAPAAPAKAPAAKAAPAKAPAAKPVSVAPKATAKAPAVKKGK